MAKAMMLFPGGFGTFSELSGADLVQTTKITNPPPMPSCCSPRST